MLHAFYRANNVHDSAKVDVFLGVVGPKTYKLLKSLIAPTLPSNKTIDELYQTLKWHVQPTDTVISHRVRFYTRKQKDTDGVTADFVAELKFIAPECEFDAFLDQVLYDIFAMGTADSETQRKLREVKQLSFAKAVEIDLMRKSISPELSGTSDKDAVGSMHALDHSSSGQVQQPWPVHSKRGHAGWWQQWGQLARSAAEQRKHRHLQVLTLWPEPSHVDMQVQAIQTSQMPQKGSSQDNVPQQSQVPWHTNVITPMGPLLA